MRMRRCLLGSNSRNHVRMIFDCSSFAAGAVRTASSTAVFAGSVAGVRSMFIDASVGRVLRFFIKHS